MRKFIPILLLCLAVPLAACSSSLSLEPGVESYQTRTGKDGVTEETRQGVRVKLGTVETKSAPESAAETAKSAAGDFKEGGEANRSAAQDAKEASSNLIVAALIGVGGLFLIVVFVLVVLLIARAIRRKD